MSTSTTIPQPPAPAVPATTNEAIAGANTTSGLVARMAPIVAQDAKALPNLINALTDLDPTLVQPVQAKALIASKTPWGTAVGLLVGWGAAKAGLMCTTATLAAGNCWTQGTVDLVTGGCVLVGTIIGSYVMRYISPAPIGGVLSAGSK